MDSSSKAFFQGLGTVIAGIFAVWLVVFIIAQVTARATPQGGQIGVVREGPSSVWIGSWFNGHQIKQIIKPGSGSTGIGLGSSVRWYPDNQVQRTYTITGDSSRGDRPGVDVDEVSTTDGIRVGLEGTFYFTTGFNGTKEGQALVKDFDNRFGVRTFPVTGQENKELHAWDGSEGWEAWLDAVIRPIIDNDLRQSIGSVSCKDLVSSCALVYNQSASAVTQASSNQATLTRIQDTINQRLQSDIATYLGGQDYFSKVQFIITGKPRLPGTIQDEIDKAQAQFAAVGTARAQVQQARLNAQANQAREKGYKGCPACAQIDELKAIPSNVTTYAPGGPFAVTK